MRDENANVKEIEIVTIHNYPIDEEKQPDLEIKHINQSEVIILPMSYRKCIKEIVAITLPLAASEVLMELSVFVSGLMLARVDNETFASVALIGSTQYALVFLGVSTLQSISVTTAKAHGEGNTNELGAIFRQGSLLATLCGVPIIILVSNIGPILKAFKQPGPIADIVASYFQGSVYSVPAIMLINSAQEFVLGVNNKKIIFGINTLYLAISSSVSYLLIFGRFGAPALGAGGYGYATTIASWTCFATYLLIFRFNKRYQPYRMFNLDLNSDFSILGHLWKLGWPAILGVSGELSIIFITSIFAGLIGENALIEQTVSFQYVQLSIIITASIFQANCLAVSNAIGRGRLRDMRRLGYTGIGIGLAFSTIVFVGFGLFPKQFISIYLNTEDPNNQEIVNTLRFFLLSSMGVQIADTIKRTAGGALYGMEDTFPMISNLFSQWLIGISLAYALTFPGNFGIYGLSTGLGISAVLLSSLFLYRWNKKSNLLIRNENIPSTNQQVDNNNVNCLDKLWRLGEYCCGLFNYPRERNPVPAGNYTIGMPNLIFSGIFPPYVIGNRG